MPKKIHTDTDSNFGNTPFWHHEFMIKNISLTGFYIELEIVDKIFDFFSAFGFCEYEDPEATLRCMRLLNEWNIASKKLVVKVDAKTKTLLDEFRAKKKETMKEEEKKESKESKENGEEKSDVEEGEENDEKKDENDKKDDLDEFTKREDRVAKAGLDAIMREYSTELAKSNTPGNY